MRKHILVTNTIDIYLGDCNEIVPALDRKYDFACCDVQYGIGASNPSKKNKSIVQKNGNRLPVAQANYPSKEWDNEICNNDYFQMLEHHCSRQLIFGGNYYGLAGGYLVWDKLNSESDQYGCELAWLSFTKRTDVVYCLWSGMMQGSYCGKDIRKALRQIGNKKLNQSRIHQCEKPIILYDYIYQTYLPEGGTVLDTHGGSMSNVFSMVKQGNISAVVIEKDIDHYNDAKKRLLLFEKQADAFRNTKIIFHH
ncbi:MAG: hypothetical protein E6Q68_08425 [Polynucleobacter sp.]|nr:MAG: hypothetical protein E6Q68_08425 [Polynucleobacter sp.]